MPEPDELAFLLCEIPDNWHAAWARPQAVSPVDWQIVQARAMEAAAHLLAPNGDTGVTGACRASAIQRSWCAENATG